MDHQKAVVDISGRQLLTSHGHLAPGLAPDEPRLYPGIMGVMRVSGMVLITRSTVWAWLIGPFVRAHLRVYKDPSHGSFVLMEPLNPSSLPDHGLRSISEIFDGDPPFTPRGCFASSAWSVALVVAQPG
ncbi:MAG: hypothetical protein M0C28_30615 [Candidatus Moduliflexus flocculans]|nr:hypothetical protein [Candidatus Moduliflexus flocculans]